MRKTNDLESDMRRQYEKGFRYILRITGKLPEHTYPVYCKTLPEVELESDKYKSKDTQKVKEIISLETGDEIVLV